MLTIVELLRLTKIELLQSGSKGRQRHPDARGRHSTARQRAHESSQHSPS